MAQTWFPKRSVDCVFLGRKTSGYAAINTAHERKRELRVGGHETEPPNLKRSRSRLEKRRRRFSVLLRLIGGKHEGCQAETSNGMINRVAPKRLPTRKFAAQSPKNCDSSCVNRLEYNAPPTIFLWTRVSSGNDGRVTQSGESSVLTSHNEFACDP